MTSVMLQDRKKLNIALKSLLTMGTDGIRSIRLVASAWASFFVGVPLLDNLPDRGGWLLLVPDEMDDLKSKQVTKQPS